MAVPRFALTPGEPAGIGPDLAVAIAADPLPCQLVAVADPALLGERAALLGQPLELLEFDPQRPARPAAPGQLYVLPQALAAPCTPGQLDTANAPYVINTLRRAIEGCTAGEFDALVTAPVQKSVINEAGVAFTGHTEFLADETGTPRVVMMLACETLRVALATTHLPLQAVPAAITRPLLEEVLHIIDAQVPAGSGRSRPRIAVLGLNPHAGEDGHMGREEIEVIEPVVEALRQRGLDLLGPLPADTAFTPRILDDCDVVLAMYHDQGLPVLKYAGFGNAVNVTLGLPFVRTSVDHGTALDIAGSGRADAGSLRYALQCAAQLSGAGA